VFFTFYLKLFISVIIVSDKLRSRQRYRARQEFARSVLKLTARETSPRQSEPIEPSDQGYADDLVILCRKGKAEAALHRLREIMGKLKRTVNEKTRICRVPEGQFDFLGYTFGRMYSARTGQAYLGHRPPGENLPDSRKLSRGIAASIFHNVRFAIASFGMKDRTAGRNA
jgi:hypothetical protein